MNLKIIKNNEILLEEYFFNEILIKNFIFESPYSAILSQSSLQDGKNTRNNNPQTSIPNKDNYSYYIICSFDLSELDKNKSLFYKNMFWEIRIFSSEIINLTKDTSKKDKEISIKDKWERNEIGRSELAKTSRLRFLSLNKLMKGEPLDKNEEIAINTERKRRIPQSYETLDTVERLKEVQKRKIINTAEDSKIKYNIYSQGKNSLPEDNLIKSEYSKYDRLELKSIMIKPELHKSYYIKNFINYSLRERIISKGQHVPEAKSKN